MKYITPLPFTMGTLLIAYHLSRLALYFWSCCTLHTAPHGSWRTGQGQLWIWCAILEARAQERQHDVDAACSLLKLWSSLTPATQDVWWFCGAHPAVAALGGGQAPAPQGGGAPGADQLQPAAQGEPPAVVPADIEARAPSPAACPFAQHGGLRASAGRHWEAPVRRVFCPTHPNSSRMPSSFSFLLNLHAPTDVDEPGTSI